MPGRAQQEYDNGQGIAVTCILVAGFHQEQAYLSRWLSKLRPRQNLAWLQVGLVADAVGRPDTSFILRKHERLEE